MEKPFRYIYPECPACKIEKCTLSGPLLNGEDGGCNNPDVMERLYPVKPVVLVSKEEMNQWRSRAITAEERVRVLEDALRFYADPNNHAGYTTWGGVAVSWRDPGRVARQALEGGTPDD